MSITNYVILAVVILAFFIIIMPIIRKQLSNSAKSLEEIKHDDVHVYMLAGALDSINGIKGKDLKRSNNIYGYNGDCSTLKVEVTSTFMHKQKHYSSEESMMLEFPAQKGRSYDIQIPEKLPKDNHNVVLSLPVESGKIIASSKFHIIVTDISEKPAVKAVRES